MCFNLDYEWDGLIYYGVSFELFVYFGCDKGYEFVCCDDMGNNVFFV